ncbi:MAG: hypothetical protein CRU72_13810 [Candidatus Accumulibacter phosphatis]|nr:hypothetical protein [Candidatus Accumulibacter phosphatis]
MSRFQARRLLLGCSASEVVLLAEPEAGTAAAQLLVAQAVAAASAALADVSAALCAALQTLKTARPEAFASVPDARLLVVTLDDSLARSFVVTPPRGAQGLRELRATAAARFAALYGESADDCLLVGDWHATFPFIVCALPRPLHQALDELAQAYSWRLASLAPALIRVGNRLCTAIPADGWLLVGFGLTLTLLNTCNDRVATTRSLRLSSAPDFATLETLVEQERLRSPGSGESARAQSLLWAGAADWLPEPTTIAGLESRTMPLSGGVSPGATGSAAAQLALAGRRP